MLSLGMREGVRWEIIIMSTSHLSVCEEETKPEEKKRMNGGERHSQAVEQHPLVLRPT
jgi:hypothetical protein